MIGGGFALASAFFYALATTVVARGPRGQSSEAGVIVSIIFTLVLSALAWAAFPMSLTPSYDIYFAGAVGLFVLSGVLASVWGRAFLFQSITHSGAIRAAMLRRLTPFFTIVLAWLLLREPIGVQGLLGILLLAISFGLLLHDSRSALSIRLGADAVSLRRGYLFGGASALAYALSQILRGFGLVTVPDPFLGTMIGAIAALLFYLVRVAISSDYRSRLIQALSTINSWQLAAGLAISVGQICQFAALTWSSVSSVAAITSLEVFLSMFLAVAVFKTERMPSVIVVVGAAIAAIAVYLISAF